MIVTSNVEGYKDKSIFLPAAGARGGSDLYDAGSVGYYWSSSLCTDFPTCTWEVHFYSDSVCSSRLKRCGGESVRPVIEGT